MPVLQQLLAQAVIVTMALGGVACLCPAGASTAGIAAPHAEHGHHGAQPVDAETGVGCGHEQCGTDCVRAAAATAKSKAVKSTGPGKDAPTLDDAAFLPAGFAARPELSHEPGRFPVPLAAPVRAHDSPVRRFDRLLD